ncbi:ABC transporter permease [Roseivirga echinicomitans]|nr:ABC transporter permease [Roseivirga echinicomitans]
MFKNFFKVTLRSLLKSKLFVFVNILGLGLALGCCIVAYLNYDFAKTFDDNHLNKDEIYQVSMKRQIQGNQVPYNFVPMMAGEVIKSEISGLKAVTRFEGRGITVKRGDQVFNRGISFADDNYLDVFTYPLKWGNKESLKDRSKVMLSEPTAIALFGDVNPVGETVEFINNNGANWLYTVGGVFESIPENTLMQFQMLMNFENIYTMFQIDRTDWGVFLDAIFIQSEDPAVANSIPNAINKYVAVQNEKRPDFMISDFWIQTMAEAPENQRDLNGGGLWQAMNPAAIVAPNVMAILILLLACFNFTNTAIAMSNKRLKEIGIRKTVGGSRGQLVFQFLGENLILCFLALIVGLTVATWLVPIYSDLWPGITLELALSQNPGLILFLVLVLLITAFMAGGYPALFVSGYKPVSILRGTLKVGSSSVLAKVLLSFQFLISVMALVSGVAFVQNARYQEGLDQGYDKSNLIVVATASNTEAQQLKNAIASNPMIENIGAMNNHIGWGYGERPVKNGDTELEVGILDFGTNYIETTGIKVLQGRSFNLENQETDRQNSILVNEKMGSSFGWAPENTVGQQIVLYDTIRYTVVGLIKDFYLNGVWGSIEPAMIRYRKDTEVTNLIVRSNPKNVSAVNAFIGEKWSEIITDRPYEGFLQEENVLGEAREINGNIVKIFLFLSVIAVILSAVGLFTLVSINIQSRTKEMGIRKVLGASVARITTIINKPFLIIVFIGAIIGAGAGYAVTEQMLMPMIYTYYIKMNFWSFFIPIASILIISLLSVSSRVINAAKRNPVESLRYE